MRHLKLLANVVEVARMGSIRKAAERLNLTPSAMNRRIQDLEAEVGTPLFERRPRGVRLTTAGEMFVRYARSQIAEADRMLSQVEDLRGLRRGPVQIACSQALALDFLPSHIAAFQKQHPKVLFDLKVMDHDRALNALAAYEVDLALVYRPTMWPSLRVIASIPQRLVVITRSDHPLAAKKVVRLSECAEYPAALPDRTLSGRQILDEVTTRRDLRFNLLAESNSFEMLRGLVFRCNMISFQIEIGAPSGDLGMGLTGRPVDVRDLPTADLVLCQLRGRSLPVAAATFAELMLKSMQSAKAGV
ncbi:LysR family transcriptional regulator [Bradyrhizobium sp. dw_411]|uniref:LysR family transcriptional regulator n=1 Tax=Bradyrhizobium sp. dw_411 TaxID=2720082 RepID=UPI001BD0B203|nr:LysR family transcriptional regulator [Bradyrhizobium sp. dw_411]